MIETLQGRISAPDEPTIKFKLYVQKRSEEKKILSLGINSLNIGNNKFQHSTEKRLSADL